MADAVWAIDPLHIAIHIDLSTYLRVLTEVIILSLSHSIPINPGYGSISLEHGSHRVAATESKSKVLYSAVYQSEKKIMRCKTSRFNIKFIATMIASYIEFKLNFSVTA